MTSSLQLLSILFLLFLSSFCVSPILGTTVTAAAHCAGGGIIPIEKIKNALSTTNFFTMSMTLDMALNTMIPSEFLNSNDKPSPYSALRTEHSYLQASSTQALP
uniref:Uncharacterized protein n=1 Tax=Nelumbo nucifera TaxID=4432 RepID=A0A822ZZC8_NELNU|nr:TPA_asm: hypothetical protein HUJ06_018652 [Nelumbo nucifera]